MGVVSDLIPNINLILGVRDDLGVQKALVNIVTRTWSGGRLGLGTATESTAQMKPTPKVVQLSNDIKKREAGVIEQGDIQLRMISKETYPNASMLTFSDVAGGVEKFFEVGGVLYRPQRIEEKHIVWNVTLARVSNQQRYTNS